MLIQLGSILALLFLIFFVTRKITTSLYLFAYILFRNRTLAIWITSLFLLPGTIIHELSHLFMAMLLHVRTGEMSILPTIEKTGEVKAGHLMIAKVGPFRHTLIGIAPMIVGIFLIYSIGYLFIASHLSLFDPSNRLYTAIGIFALFCISTTMFSSKKDMESFAFAAPIFVLIFSALYVLRSYIGLTQQRREAFSTVFDNLIFYLLLTIIIDVGVFLFCNLGLFALKKLLRVHLTLH